MMYLVIISQNDGQEMMHTESPDEVVSFIENVLNTTNLNLSPAGSEILDTDGKAVEGVTVWTPVPLSIKKTYKVDLAPSSQPSIG